jgi:hypothetical protein
MGFMSIVPILLMTDWDKAKSNVVLDEAVQKMLDVNRRLWESSCFEAKACSTLLKASQLLKSGKVNTALRMIRRGLSRKDMDNFKLVKAMHMCVLARFTIEEKERETRRLEAKKLIDNVGAKALGNWALGLHYTTI